MMYVRLVENMVFCGVFILGSFEETSGRWKEFISDSQSECVCVPEIQCMLFVDKGPSLIITC